MATDTTFRRPGTPVELEISVIRAIHEASDSAYRVLSVQPKAVAEPFVARGYFGPTSKGEKLTISGRWVVHPRHGRQFEVEAIDRQFPTTEKGIVKFLTSNFVRGLGPVYAQRIASHFGTEIFRRLDKNPHAVEAVQGVPDGIKRAVAAAWVGRQQEAKTFALLASAGLGNAMISRIVQKYGATTPLVVMNDTYRLAREISGIGFVTADAMARKLGCQPDDPRRIEAGVLHALYEHMDEGHTAIERVGLLRAAERLLQVSHALIEAAIHRLVDTGHVEEDTVGSRRLIYAPEALRYERTVVARLRAVATGFSVKSEPIDRAIADAESETSKKLNQKQLEGVVTAYRSPVSLLIGEPGTGKTFATEILVKVLQRLEPHGEILPVAPTGRATRPLSRSTGLPALTIQRALEYSPREHAFTRNEYRPFDATTIIPDEGSMIDLCIMAQLSRAIRPGARFFMAGDIGQLYPVAYGQPFADLINSGIFPVTQLTEIRRQAKEGETSATDSAMVNAARAIRAGIMPIFPDDPNSDLRYIPAINGIDARTEIVHLCRDILPAQGFDPLRDIQILAPRHDDHAGVKSLNATLAPIINPGPADPSFRVHSGRARIGDRVQQMVPDAAKGVVNGDHGFVVDISSDPEAMTVDFDGHRATYNREDADDIDLAYAITIHRSQGSEYPVVIVPLVPEASIMLRRNLAITAFSRARKLTIFVGLKRCLAKAVQTVDTNTRQGALCERLISSTFQRLS